MFIIGVAATLALLGFLKLRRRRSQHGPGSARRLGAGLAAFTLAAAALFTVGGTANAANGTVDLGTAADFAVLASTTVTNTGDSVLDGSVGVWPGDAITGFPPGVVLPPGSIHEGDEVAELAQADLTAAYLDAEGRPIDATTTSDLAGLTLQAGVYAGPDHSPLELNGTLTLDGAGDPNSVFIFQTDSTLITQSSSTVSLINGAQACNVFWQVGSAATLGTDSVFVGNILALASVTVNTNVTVEGRALALTAAVTLDDDTFTDATCDETQPTTTTTNGETTTTTNGETTTTDGQSTTTVVETPTTIEGSPGGDDAGAPGDGSTDRTGTAGETDEATGSAATPSDGPTQPGNSPATPAEGDADGPESDAPDLTENRLTDRPDITTSTTDLPRTGSSIFLTLVLAGAALTMGALALGIGRNKGVSRP